MSEQPASTPAGQQQHQPPSSPNSPHPKRVKTDNLLNNDSTPQSTIPPTMPTHLPHVEAVRDANSTPTPSNSIPLPAVDLSTLPPVSSLLPSISSNPPMLGSNLNLPMLPGGVPPMSAIPPTAAPPLMVKKLGPDAITPTRGSAYAAGYDLYASAPLTLKAKSKGLISTGIAIAVPAGTYGRVAPRSGLASKHFLDTGAGVIDADYRGEVKVLMFNFNDTDYEVKQGERVAQLVLEKIVTPEVMEVQELEESVRGAGGFGSTGYI